MPSKKKAAFIKQVLKDYRKHKKSHFKSQVNAVIGSLRRHHKYTEFWDPEVLLKYWMFQ